MDMRPSLLDEFGDKNARRPARSENIVRNGTLLSVQDDNRVEVQVDGSDAMVLPAVPGVYVIGASVPVLFDHNRRPVRVLGAGEPPSEDHPEIDVHGYAPAEKDAVEVITDTTPPPTPSAPVLSTRLGVIKVAWDGSPEMPADFSFIEVAMSASPGATTVIDRIYSNGSISVTDQPYKEERYFRFRAYDRSGNASGWSAESSIATQPLVDVDLIETTIDEQIQANRDAVAEAERKAIGAQTTADAAKTTADEAEAAAADAVAKAQTAADAAEAAEALAGAAETAADTSAQAALDALAQAEAAGGDATAAQAAADAAQAAADEAQRQATTAGTAASQADAAAAQAAADAAQALADAAAAASSATTSAEEAEAARQRADTAVANAQAAAQAAEDAENAASGAAGSASAAEIAADAAAADALAALQRAQDAEGDAVAAQAAADAAQTAADASAQQAEAAGTAAAAADAAAAQAAADAAQAIADAAAAKSAAEAAEGKADAAVTAAQSAQTAADNAVSEAEAAKTTADDAATAAAEAAGIAAGKGDVLIQSAEPSAEMRKATTLWIDTTDGANTPKRWTGSAWDAVTDQAALDAAVAASEAASAASDAATAAEAAQSRADEAHSLAGTAESNAQAAITSAHAAATAADNAQQAADLVPKNLFSTGVPTGTAPYGTIWFRVNSTGEVIGQWQQTTGGIASTWTPRQVRSEVIANLDVGKLTAGTASVVELEVANLLRTNILTVGSIDDPTIIADGTITTRKLVVDGELWAELAQFVSIKAGQLDANEIWSDDTWTGHARAEVFTAGAVPPKALAVGIDELLLDPLWENSELWASDGPLGGQVPNGYKFRWSTSSTYRQYGQARVLYTLGGTSSTTLSAGDRIYLTPEAKPVSPGDSFRLAFEARTSSTNHDIALGLEVLDASGTKITDIFVAPSVLTLDEDGNQISPVHPLNTMFNTDGVVTVPAGGFQVRPWIGAKPGDTPTSGSWYISRVSMRAIMSSVISDWRTEVTGRGLEVINPEGISVIRLGAFENIGIDLYETRVELDDDGNPIKNDDGTDLVRAQPTAHLHEDGSIGGEFIFANKSLEYKGTELEERFDELPKGMLTRISVAGSSLTNIPSTGGFLDVAEIQFTMVPGRVYRIASRPINVLLGSSGTTASSRAVSASLYWTKDGTRPTRQSERIFMDNHTPASTSLERVTFNCERLAHVNETEGPLTIRVLLSLASAERSLNVQEVLSLFAEDLGWDTGPNGGIVRNYMRANATTPPPSAPDPVRTYKKTYGYSWHRTWQENGVISSQSQDAAYQGQTPYYTAAGRYRSMVGVKNMTTDLQNAKITRVRVRLRMDHSHSASGGTVVMGFHGSGSRPSTFSGTNYRPGYKFARGQEKWITLPSSLYEGFKNGNIKGVSFYSSSRNSEYYVKMSPGRVAFEVTYER